MEKKRILVIDDEPGFTRMVRLHLEGSGEFEVLEENRPLHAFAATREFKPDLILLDVIMPTMDGGDVAAQIQLDPHLRDTPVIFVTASVSRREAGAAGLNSGGELFLAKPVSASFLMQRIHEKLGTGPASDKEKLDEVTAESTPGPAVAESSHAAG